MVWDESQQRGANKPINMRKQGFNETVLYPGMKTTFQTQYAQKGSQSYVARQ